VIHADYLWISATRGPNAAARGMTDLRVVASCGRNVTRSRIGRAGRSLPLLVRPDKAHIHDSVRVVDPNHNSHSADGLAEIKTGTHTLDSSYQLRLQTYGSVVNDTPLTIYTSRPVSPTFSDYLTRWGVSVKPLPTLPPPLP